MIACPECGLPRADDEVGVVPCPVCAAAPGVASRGSRPPLARTETRDPLAGMPADVSQMEAQAGAASNRILQRLVIALAFGLGIAVGVGGLLAWQRSTADREPPAEPSQTPVEAHAPVQPARAAPASLAIAPRPRVKPLEIAPAPSAVVPIFPLLPPVVVELDDPDSVYTVPPPTKKGEHIVLRGKVRMLRVEGLDGGALLDATGLEAGSIYVEGKIDGRSVLKLAALDGVVAIPASVSGRSRVEINAPGCEVRFPFPTTDNRPGSQITGGSTVTIVGRTVDLRGDIDGLGTKVDVTLTRNGSLKVAAVRGTAAVEYRSANARATSLNVAVFSVAPTATFRRAAD
jgi:hypothetical protein